MTAHILYISKYVVPPQNAKVSSRGFHLLSEFTKLGYLATLITSDSNHLASTPSFKGSHLHEFIEGVDVFWLKTNRYKAANSIWRVISWFVFEFQLFAFDKSKIQPPKVLIVSSLSLLTILNAIILRRKYKCQLVFEVRDIWPMVLTETGRFSRFNPFIQFLSYCERLGYRHADLIVGTMPNLQKRVKETSVSNKKVICIPQGVDKTFLEQISNQKQARPSFQLDTKKFNICYAGSIGADNAIETFFQCAEILKDNPQIHFSIVGDGYLKSSFESQYGHLDNITFQPRLDRVALHHTLKHFDLLYFSTFKSKLTDYGQSLNKLIDYMLAARPVVGSYSGFPSMITEANCGSFVEAENADALSREIEKYRNMPREALDKLGLNGRNWILKNRSYDALAHEYISSLSL